MVRVRRVTLATAVLLAGATAPLLISSASAQEVRQIRPVPQAVQQAAPQTKQAVVSATSGWTPTGVAVRNGARLQISAQGRWTMAQSVAAAPPVSGPEGVAGRTDPRAPLPGANLGALVGRIGANGKPFLVGANYDATASGDGELFLAINENPAALADNSGRIAASATMRPVGTTPTITRPLRDLTVANPRVTIPQTTPPPQTTTPGTTTQQPPTRGPVQSTIPVQTTRPTTQPPATQTPPTRTPPTQQTPPSTTVPGTRNPPTQTPPSTQTPPTRTPPSTQQPPTTQPPTRTPPSTQQPPTTRPPTRVPVDPTTGAPKEPERPPEPQTPTTQTPPEPEAPPTPASDTPPVVEQAPPAQTTPIEPVPPAVVPAPPAAAPASPIVPILAAILGLAVLATFFMRAGAKRQTSRDDPASAPRISARVSADGRSNQELSVSFRGRA